jgi:transmembrane sensor
MPSPLAHAALNAPQSSSRRQALKLLLILGVGSAATYGLRQQHLPIPPLTAGLSAAPSASAARYKWQDGSQLQLNTASAVDVQLRTPTAPDPPARRRDALLIAANQHRPLQIITGQGCRQHPGGAA